MTEFCAVYGCNNWRSIVTRSRRITFHKIFFFFFFFFFIIFVTVPCIITKSLPFVTVWKSPSSVEINAGRLHLETHPRWRPHWYVSSNRQRQSMRRLRILCLWSLDRPSLPVIHPPTFLPQLPVPQQPNFAAWTLLWQKPVVTVSSAPDTKQTWRQCPRKSAADIIYPKSSFGPASASVDSGLGPCRWTSS